MERAAGGWWMPLALLLIASVATTSAQEASSNDEVLFEFGRNITLRCNLPHEPSQPIAWFRQEKSVDTIPELKDRYEVSEGGAVWSIHRAFEDDYGNYSCSVGPNQRKWTLLPAQIYGKLPQDTNVVEGQKLKLTCKLIGKPYPKVLWTYTTNLTAESGEDVRTVFGDRVTLRNNEQGAEDGELLLEAAVRTDAGKFFCLADGYPSPTRGGHSSRLRVKDMYAALWPFLGICAEVLVLCAVILVYERRRAKPELDDSDTDHQDQKKS